MTSSDTLRAAPGPSRRQLIAGATGLAGALLGQRAAFAQDASAANADFLFVQTADSMAFAADRNRLTLHDVGPTTLFFSDRPDRIAGTMTTESFVPFWSEGKDSFLSDPPNADISILEDGTLRQTVAVLKDPVLANGDLHYLCADHRRRHAGPGRERLGLHRHHRHAADAALCRRRRSARLPACGTLLTSHRTAAGAPNVWGTAFFTNSPGAANMLKFVLSALACLALPGHRHFADLRCNERGCRRRRSRQEALEPGRGPDQRSVPVQLQRRLRRRVRAAKLHQHPAGDPVLHQPELERDLAHDHPARRSGRSRVGFRLTNRLR